MDRDILYQDIEVIDSIYMRDQPINSFSIMPNLMKNLGDNDFYFTVYAPYVFKFLRYKYNLDERDFMVGLFFFKKNIDFFVNLSSNLLACLR